MNYKNSLKLSILFFIILSCSRISNYDTKDYSTNTIIQAYVGASMISTEKGIKDVKGKSKRGHRTELVYGGVSGNTIYIDYREYSVEEEQSFIRAGFTQRVVYDIGESDTIRYKDNLLKIITANSEEIVFTVLSDSREEIRTPNEVIKSGNNGYESIVPQNKHEEECAKRFLLKNTNGEFSIPNQSVYEKYLTCCRTNKQ